MDEDARPGDGVCVCVCTCVCIHAMMVLSDHILTSPLISTEPAGTNQVSPVSPTRPPLNTTTTLPSGEGGSVEPVALNLPTVRVRRNSDNNRPSPKYVAGATAND